MADAGRQYPSAGQAHEALAAGLPEKWVEAAEAWYSMHGAGLVRNLLAGAAPLIAAAERERIGRAIEASIVAEPGQRYERWPCTCLDGGECFPHAVHRAMNQVTARCDEDTWPVVIAGAVWDALEPLIRRDAASIARQPPAQEEWSQGEVQGAHRCGYRLLADAVIAHLDVRDGDEAEVALCVEAVERAASPRLTEAGRWQAEQARDLLRRWDSAHGPDIYGAERTLADQLRGMLALLDQLAPRETGTG